MSGGTQQQEAEEVCPSESDLQAFVGGGLKEPAQARLESHLAECARCRIAIGDVVETTSPHWPSALGVRTLAEGEVVADRYTIGVLLGKGGMGEVYAAHDALLQEQVALKTLLFTTLDDPEAVRRMKAEVQLARRVSHPHVCRILEFGLHQRAGGGVIEAIPYLTMELLAGKTLAQHLRQQGPLPWQEAIVIFRQVIAGLAAIHRSGIVHRDFKGENVFLANDAHGSPRAVITDFGLAKSREDMRSRNSLAFARGTLAYMAPEQLEGKGAEMPADVYALGTVMFEALVGQLPFAGEPGAPPDLWGRCRKKAPKVRDFNQAVPSRWCDVIDKALQREADKRFADAQAVLIALDGKHTGKAARRVVALSLAGLLTVVATVYIAASWRRTPTVHAPAKTSRASAVVGARVDESAVAHEVPTVKPEPQAAAPPSVQRTRRRSPRREPPALAGPQGEVATPLQPKSEAVKEAPPDPDGIVNPFPRLRSRTNRAGDVDQGAK